MFCYLALTLLGIPLLGSASPASAAYVPGMNCQEVAGFAEVVVEQKNMPDGVGLKEALEGLGHKLIKGIPSGIEM
jgi:hypothetical protein